MQGGLGLQDLEAALVGDPVYIIAGTGATSVFMHPDPARSGEVALPPVAPLRACSASEPSVNQESAKEHNLQQWLLPVWRYISLIPRQRRK